MNGKLALSFSVATFVVALGAMYFLSEVRVRLKRLEPRHANAAGATAAAPSRAQRRNRFIATLMLRVPISTLSSRFLNARLSQTFTARWWRLRS